jgi:sn-glycerol 3-phosphate transport system ATP-binding protein
MGRAMIREPKVFLFDEPLSNLDAKLRVQMRLEIRKLHQRLGAPSVFVTHDQVEAMTLADRIVVMNAGLIEQIGTPTEIYERPETLFVAGFIGSPPMNLIEAEIRMPGEAVAGGIHLVAPALSSLPIGTRAIIGIRPEQIEVRAAGRQALRADFVEKLGPVQLVHGHFAGQDFILQCPSTEHVAAGQELRFDIDPGMIHVFDAASGARLKYDHAKEQAAAAIAA